MEYYSAIKKNEMMPFAATWMGLYITILHIFFIHSSVDGLLGCFHVLAVINSATMKTEVHVSFSIKACKAFLDFSNFD